MADTFGCSSAKSMFTQYAEDIKSAIKAPLVAIRHANRMARKISNALLADFNTAMSGVNSIINSLPNVCPSISAAQAAVSALAKCAAVVNTPGAAQQLALVNKALGSCKKYANAPKFVHDYINKTIIDAAMASYNNTMQKNVFAKINKMGSDYNKMLKSTGIKKGLDTMDGLINCMSSLCSAVDKEISILNGYRDKLGLTNDDNTITDAANNLISNAATGLTKKVTDTQKALLKDCNSQMDAAKKTITSFKLEVKDEG